MGDMSTKERYLTYISIPATYYFDDMGRVEHENCTVSLVIGGQVEFSHPMSDASHFSVSLESWEDIVAFVRLDRLRRSLK